MGNTQTTVSLRSNRSNGTIEIIMADEQFEETQIINNECEIEPYIYRSFSADSLLSVISASSSTQTDPHLFTQWPKRRFLFKWLEKLKNYHLLLTKSTQILNSTMFINSRNEGYGVKMGIRSLSHSTQTVNQIADNYSLFDTLSIKSMPKIRKQSLNILSIKSTSDELQSEGNKIFHEMPLKKVDTIVAKSPVDRKEMINEEFIHNNSLSKRPKLQTQNHFVNDELDCSQAIPSKCKLLDMYGNNFGNSDVNKSKERCNSNEMMSSESLTSVTLISKHENSGLIYKVSSNRKRNYKLRLSCNDYNNCKPFPLKNRKIRRRNNQKRTDSSSNIFNHKSNTNYKNISMQQPLSVISSVLQENSKSTSKTDDIEELGNGKIQVLSYKFWIGANCKNWNIFHNPTDRRIESIGRMAKCKIQLTNIIARHSDGMLKQQVIVYAPDQSSLEKCCKLFDDKFPNFYATSGLIRILYFQSDSKLGTLMDNYRNMPHINIPISSHINDRSCQRKVIKKFKKDVNQLQFLSNELLSG